MEKCCKNCKLLASLCSVICPFPEVGCSEFIPRPKKYVLVDYYLYSGHCSIIAFSDSFDELKEIRSNHPRCFSTCHDFSILLNDEYVELIKDKNLADICKNVALYLDVAEYAMLKKSYSKASAWFDKAKNSASVGAEIIDNY